uniref:Nop domain-containing protein n=1 Tax=Acrobeloides nanus TaxID=290746 RepID=A0A914E437_9BILA
MLVLFETAAGFAIFKVLDESKLNKVDNIWSEFKSADQAQENLKLVSFKKFKTPDDAIENINAINDGKLSKVLKKLLKSKAAEIDELAVGDSKLGSLIKEKLEIPCVHNTATSELMRSVRSHLDTLLGDYKTELDAMNLAVSHSLGRFKVKFNPEKIDTMIVQAVSLLDDLDKELNNYAMRCREWYGWHFPELGKIISDHMAFAKVVKAIGMKQNAQNVDLSKILPEELEQRVKEEAEISMGTDISELDILNISQLCDQIIDMMNYRAQLHDYLKNRMNALAPNLTVLLGELIGARLISKAGSLVNLAKYPASTVQILGAEKALFRALKTKKDTPKYGIIYHAQLIGQASARSKGKMARKLAAKVSLSTRFDALCDESIGNQIGFDARVYLESQLKNESERGPKRISGQGKKFGTPGSAGGNYKFKSHIFEAKEESPTVEMKPLEEKVRFQKGKRNFQSEGEENRPLKKFKVEE